MEKTSATLFISCSKRGVYYANDASARYRCIYQCMKTRAEGKHADIIHMMDALKISLSNYDQVIIHRPRNSLRLSRFLRKARKLNIQVSADYDDLLFRPDLAHESPTVLSGKESLHSARKQAESALKALRKFSSCRMSTAPLIEMARSVHPNCSYQLVHNMVPDSELPKEIVPAEERFKNKVIRYFPGTSHHSANFKVIEKVLAEWLTEHPEAKLEVVGGIKINHEIFPDGQLLIHPFMPYTELPKLISTSWITIAPLEDNHFNNCKSGLKFWESSAYGVPVVAAPNEDLKRFSGAGLRLPKSPESWKESLSYFLEYSHYHTELYSCSDQIKHAYFPSQSEVWNASEKIKSLNVVMVRAEAAQSKIRRKFRKLWRSPIMFIKDAIYKLGRI